MNRFTLQSFAAIGLSLLAFIVSLTSLQQAGDSTREYESKLREFEQRMQARIDVVAPRNRDQERQDILRSLAFEKIALREAVCNYLYPRGESDVDRSEPDIAKEMITNALYIRRINDGNEEQLRGLRERLEKQFEAAYRK